MTPKFEKLYQHSVGRFTQGGVQVLDYVKLKRTDIEGAPDSMNDELKRIKGEDLNIKVLEVVKVTPEDGGNKPNLFAAVIGQELASGIFPQKFTVPVDALEVVGYNVPPEIPDSWRHKSKEDKDGKPEVLDLISGTKAQKKEETTSDFQTL